MKENGLQHMISIRYNKTSKLGYMIGCRTLPCRITHYSVEDWDIYYLNWFEGGTPEKIDAWV
jgi:hypothetical protein